MSLPVGFDPETGTLGRVSSTVRGYMPSSIHTQSRSASGDSWWSNFNNRIASIGEWIQETGAVSIAMIITAIPTFVLLYKLIKWNIDVFSDDGFIWGALSICADFMAIGIGYYAVLVLFGIIYFVLFLLGYIFYNAYTLIITIAIILFFSLGGCKSSSSYSSGSIPTEAYEAPATTTYVCTARKSLKVRRYPTTNAPQIGSLYNGQEIEVLDISDGFAHFKLNGNDGYASTQYLRKK